MVSLLIGLRYAILQLPLDNRENENLQNVSSDQNSWKCFPAKISLIQYILKLSDFDIKSVEVYTSLFVEQFSGPVRTIAGVLCVEQLPALGYIAQQNRGTRLVTYICNVSKNLQSKL